GLVVTVAGSLTGMFVPSLHELNFFHQAAVILAVVKVGRYLEVRARGRAWPALAAHFFSPAPAPRRCEPAASVTDRSDLLAPVSRRYNVELPGPVPSIPPRTAQFWQMADRPACLLIPATIVIAGVTLTGWLTFGGTAAAYQAISATAAVLLT